MQYLKLILLITIACIGLTSSSTSAQDVIGTAVVGGKRIQILSDNTWQFEERLTKSCYLVSAELNFCGRDGGWKPLAIKSPQITAQFERAGSTEFANFIIEKVGQDVGINLNAYASGVMTNLANGMGVDPAEIPVYFDRSVEFYGKDARQIGAQATLNGVDFVLINTFWVDDDRSGQIFTYAFGREMGERHEILHQQVVGSLSFVE